MDNIKLEEEIELQLLNMKEEDTLRFYEKLNTPNLRKINEERRRRESLLYSKQPLRGANKRNGIDYKKNLETDDLFLSKFYNKEKKYINKISNRKFRYKEFDITSKGGYKKY